VRDLLNELMDEPAPEPAEQVDDSSRFIGCPISWFDRVFPLVHGKGELAVSLYVYRLRCVQRRKTVRVPNGWLRKRGISRHTKYRTLNKLAAAGLITLRRCGGGAVEITFLR
jgi:hypothetical protein